MRASKLLGTVCLAFFVAGCGDDPVVPHLESGLPEPMEDIYWDEGPADTGDRFRALMGFPTRDVEGLETAIQDMYDPTNAAFRQTMTVDEWMAKHAPLASDFETVASWIEGGGMKVDFRASNRLLFAFSGTVAQFNAAFQTTLHKYGRSNPASGRPPLTVYGSGGPLTVPSNIMPLVTGVVTVDYPADDKPLPGEGGDIVEMLPPDAEMAHQVSQIAGAYGLDEMYALGHDGTGIKLGLIVGATFKFKDLQSFWRSMGITRADPVVVQTMEPIATRYLETSLDMEWAGALAPGADLIAYSGPDARGTSIVYTYNEAVGRAEVSVLSSSFAHREEVEAPIIHRHFNDASRMAAALGISIAVSSGDSSRPDVPATSPFVTCVGGTRLTLAADGSVESEEAWSKSGSGNSRIMKMPWYQEGVVPPEAEGMRAVADVALAASAVPGYWVYYLGEWDHYGGTSFASPVFAGFLAVMNAHRAANGKTPVGLLNPLLYQMPEVQKTFRDITTGQTEFHAAGPGWDYPTGWGAPLSTALADALP